MKAEHYSLQNCMTLGRLLGAGLIIALIVNGLHADAKYAKAQETPTKKQPTAPHVLEVHFFDGGIMKLTLLDERVELATRYGKLLIPVAEIRRIDFAWRVEDEVAKRIDAAVADLGNMNFKQRQIAQKEIEDIDLKAYPALLKAAKNADPEVAKRAGALLDKIRQSVPAELLEVRLQDVVHTDDSTIAGQLTASKLKVKTAQFGEQHVKLADMVSLQTPGSPMTAGGLPDPGTLTDFQGQIGNTYTFKVKGAAAGSQGIWGTGTYTLGSTLSVAAVHAGALKSGQTGLVRVTIMGQVPAFVSSTQNGITSNGYGVFAGYRIELGKK